MEPFKLFGFFCLYLALATEAKKSYNGFSVLRTADLNSKQSFFLQSLESNGTFHFWRSARVGSGADIMTGPEQIRELKNVLVSLDIEYSVMVADVQELISKSAQMKSLSRQTPRYDWENFFDHNAINDYIDQLVTEDESVKTVSMGKTYENRDMRVLQILKAGEGKANVFIEAGIHAREWIAPAMATYLIRELLEGEGQHYLEHLNFHILPSANPDGYEFTRTEDRMWRKTVSETQSTFGCLGVDGNRNWDIHFGETGSSDYECSETYHGGEPFSEVEMRNIRDYVLALEPSPILTVNLHSYSQLWMYPYGYGYFEYPENVEEIKALGEAAVKAVQAVHGKVFDPICSADLYPAPGTSQDWYSIFAKSRFAYTIELRDTGSYGFLLPEIQIIPSGEELWAGMKVTLDKMVELSSTA